jgi:TonB family protein
LKTGGGLSGVEVGKIAGIATGSAADKVEKARGGSRIEEGTGGIDVTELSEAQIDELLAASSVEIAELPEVEGLAAKNVNRSGASIRAVADANQKLVKNCYNKYKRKDINLKGKVKVEWTILPSGKVSKVRIISSEWTNPRLGRRVEAALMEVISTWLFDPIPPESGPVRARQTYIFD